MTDLEAAIARSEEAHAAWMAARKRNEEMWAQYEVRHAARQAERESLGRARDFALMMAAASAAAPMVIIIVIVAIEAVREMLP